MPVSFRSTVIQSTRLAAAALWLAAISALLSPALAVTTDPADNIAADNIAVPASLLEVHLVDALSGDALTQQRIDAYQRQADGRLSWRARASTDDEGLAGFDLARKGIEPAMPIILRARPFGSNVYSDAIGGPGAFRFEAGKLSIRLVSGATEQVMPETSVHLKRVDEDGRLHWVARATSDARGVVRFDAEGLGNGASFVARARSLVNGEWKTSQAMGKAGVYEFVVGNKPVTMVVFDALARSPMADVRVDAYTVGEDGKRRSVGRASTDNEGAAPFDIDGLGLPGGPSEVVFKARVFGNHATSPAVTTPGTYKFPVGTLAVRALSGDTGEPLPDHDVHLREVLDTGKTRWSMRGRADAEGLVRLTPPGLGSGRSYMAQSRSPISGALWSSEAFSEPGSADFIIGNKPLLVKLVDGVSGAPLPEQRIDAVEILGGDQRPKSARRATTDKEGMAVLELEGLGDGRIFALRARVYNGGVVQTPPVDTPGKLLFQVGTSPVTLIDAVTGKGMAQRKLVAYRMDASGKRRWYRAGVTDAEGTVRFDLPGVSKATPYVIKAVDPFGDKQHFYSDAIVAQGKVAFPIQRDADREPPAVSIASPAQGAELPIADFEVRGEASDNEALADVSLSVGTTPVAVDLNASTGAWAAKVDASLLSAGQSLAITATARDEAGNRADTTHIVTVANVDTIAPELRVTSPATGDGVPATGFTIAGTVTDDGPMDAVLVSVAVQSGTGAVDPVVDAPAVYDPATDSWSLRILSSQLPADGTIGISVQARDDAGNSSTASVDDLRVLPVTADVRHLVNRVTFGPTLELLERVNTMGAGAFLAEQLDPAAIEDSDFEAMRDAFGPVDDKTKLQVYQLLHAIHSERQLNEVMTVFWDNHFNTNVNASNSGQDNEVVYEKVENDAFRTNALGNFRDLLAISAKSPAMLVYLDTISNVASDPNENYPRELLELHTVGVDGGYSQDDVEEVARAFTGWQLVNGAFSFAPSLHDADEKTVLGVTIPARDPALGVQDGEDVLDILAVHPSTASFVCTKLAVALVIDTPPDALVDDCKTTFLAAADDADQIAQVLSVVLSAAQFNDPANHGAKVKTPLEVVAGIVRALHGAGTLGDLPGFTRSMGMRLFENPVPTGFPDTGDEWISAGQLVERYKTADRIVFNSPGGNRTSVQPLVLAQSNGADTAESVVDLILELTVGEDFTALERQVAVDVLTDGGTTPYTPLVNPQEADARLRAVLGTVMSFPAFQFQ